MRSTSFVILSLLIHGFCVAALILTPTRTISADKEGQGHIEVTVGEPGDQAGLADADAADAPAQPVATAEPAKVAPVAKTAPTKVARAHRATVAHTAPVEKAEKSVAKEDDPVLVPVKETPPAGVEAADSNDEQQPVTDIAEVAPTEAPATTATTATTAAAPEAPATTTTTAAAVAPVAAGAGDGALAKGGASKEGAVSYLDLKQLPGNKPPGYPINARLEKRQGQLELVYRVTKEGKVTDMQLAKSSGSKDLDSEAMRAIAQFRFVPGQEGWARHPVNFALKGPVAALPSKLRNKDAQND